LKQADDAIVLELLSHGPYEDWAQYNLRTYLRRDGNPGRQAGLKAHLYRITVERKTRTFPW
jgi:hypothetical protein